MTADLELRESMYWMKDKTWFRINEKGRFELTDAAPERARKSFELYCKRNHRET